MDQGKNIEALTSSIEKIGNQIGGLYVERFRDACMCGSEKCTLRKYESTAEIDFNGIKLTINSMRDKRQNIPTYPDLSDVARDIANKLNEEIYDRIPKNTMALFDVLNPLSWPADEQ